MRGARISSVDHLVNGGAIETPVIALRQQGQIRRFGLELVAQGAGALGIGAMHPAQFSMYSVRPLSASCANAPPIAAVKKAAAHSLTDIPIGPMPRRLPTKIAIAGRFAPGL
jgi:hypothetical protein